MRRLGITIGLAYLAVAALTFSITGLKVRPLFDGNHAGIAYRWVDPPPSEEPFNLPPESGEGEVELTRRGSRDGEVQTLDLLAGVLFPSRAFAVPAGEEAISVSVEPLDPKTIGPVPAGKEFQGNAYAFAASYGASGDDAELRATSCDPTADVILCPTIFLTVPFGATDLARWDGNAWVPLPGMEESSPVVFADSPVLGTFVALAEEGRIESVLTVTPATGFPLRDVIAIVAGGVATIGLSFWYRRRLTSQKREEVRKRAAGRKYKTEGAKERKP